jgi:signal transduction histidine kinase
VIDQGLGFPRVVRENLGQPFFSTSEAGAGLGLYHAVTLCKAMGGYLKVEDRMPPTTGSLVKTVFPLASREKKNLA